MESNSDSKSWISNNLNRDEKVEFNTRLFSMIFRYIPILNLKWKRTEFIVTNQRVIIKSGIFSIHVSEIALDKINSVKFDQGMLERMVGSGSINIETASRDGDLKYQNVAMAKEFRARVLSAQESFQETKVMKQAEVLASAIAAKQQPRSN